MASRRSIPSSRGNKGFLARENIKLDYVPIPGGTDKMVAALDQGRLDVDPDGHALPDSGGAGRLRRGGDRGRDRQSDLQPDRQAGDRDLRRPQGQARRALAAGRYDLDLHAQASGAKGLRDTDYQVKELVGTPVRFDCLKRGECDAVPLGQPDDLIAVHQGYRRLGDSTEAIAAFQFQVIAARRGWAQANKESWCASCARSVNPSGSSATAPIVATSSRR